MSVFSDLLSEYITMKDVGVYPLSQFCGLDRSFMYKIINGKRNPSGEDVVRKMAQFMQLTPREKTDFMGFLARGDRKCAEVIEKAYRKGSISERAATTRSPVMLGTCFPLHNKDNRYHKKR